MIKQWFTKIKVLSNSLVYNVLVSIEKVNPDSSHSFGE